MLNQISYISPLDQDFPPVEHASTDPDGLLAIGGDLSPTRLMSAYRQGIFPWFNEGEPILWWSPSIRGVLEFEDFRINRTFAKFLKKNPYRITINNAFSQVILHCQQVKRNGYEQAGATWITNDMVSAYEQLHSLGNAHSIEVWEEEQLVGGLYGVLAGSVFCGESMFHLKSNASRVAYACLVKWLKQHGGAFIDCQMQNDFLKTLGVRELSRDLYLQKLKLARQIELPKTIWQPQTIDY